MSQKFRLILAVEPREAGRRRFLAAMNGQHQVSVSAVPLDPSRSPVEERALRTRAVCQAREMLEIQGGKLSPVDEAQAQRFIDGDVDRAELNGVRL